MADIIIAGFGGQGVLGSWSDDHLFAGMIEDKAVSWFPSYGPEQRGGTCNCSVVVARKRRSARHLFTAPSAAIVMNVPSFDRFEPRVAEGGSLDLQLLFDR
jgi:2-oxoglutarate ferredoxin oxidoreductase subunit gamma